MPTDADSTACAVRLERAPKVGTLYIPPLSERPVEDADLLEVMLTTGSEASASS